MGLGEEGGDEGALPTGSDTLKNSIHPYVEVGEEEPPCAEPTACRDPVGVVLELEGAFDVNTLRRLIVGLEHAHEAGVHGQARGGGDEHVPLGGEHDGLGRGDAAALVPVLDDTVTQAHRASAILERFRNWSRPQSAPASVFDLREAVGNVRALLAPQAATCGVQLEFDIPKDPVAVIADSVEMEQVVFNLVRNAIAATGHGNGAGRVAVRLLQDRRRTLLEVVDNGPGVPEELRPRLFTPFTTTRVDGTGLGLALSQRLVERAGGEIALIDGGLGATFRVVLPRHEGFSEAAQ